LAGVPGTTWKKKSRQGSPEDANVGDEFSVSVFAGIGGGGGGVVGLLKPASSRSTHGSPVVGAFSVRAVMAARRKPDGGPVRV
jgi:hypothetical protein